MEIPTLTQSLGEDAAAVVFANVLLQQLGLPIPAVPTLLVAGSLLAGGPQAALLLAAAVLASVCADWLWYLAGRRFGYRVLAGLCRLSLNPASCVSQTEERFVRWGPWSLVGAKFIPGFSTVAPPIAGALRMSLAKFLLAAGLGAALWGGAALAAGWLFRAQLQRLMMTLQTSGAPLLAFVLALLSLWLGWKLWQKFRFRQLAAIPHISVDEFVARLAAGTPPRLLDLRGTGLAQAGGPLPGGIPAHLDGLRELVREWPRDTDIVTLCACPQDASAVAAAHALRAAGFASVRPLRGGFAALHARLNAAAD